MIAFRCKNCGQKLRVNDQHSGKRSKCPKCSRVSVVPAKLSKIKFHCKKCGQSIGVAQTYAGKKGECPKCKSPVVVPSLKRKLTDGTGINVVVLAKQPEIKFHCMSCNQNISVSQIYAGKQHKCPKCKNPVFVPSPERKPTDDIRIAKVIGSTRSEAVQVPQTSPESATSMFSIFEELAKLRAFRRTRSAVHTGEDLASLSKSELRNRGMLGPWTLNIFESFLASLPSIVIIAILDIITYPVLPVEQTEVDRITRKLLQYTTPFILPFGLMLYSWIAGWSSFRRKDGTKEQKRHARYYYLYLDGSYGLVPQALLVTAFSLIIYLKNLKNPPCIFYSILLIVFFISTLWNIKVNFRDIPARLFAFNVYSPSKPKFFRFASKRETILVPGESTRRQW